MSYLNLVMLMGHLGEAPVLLKEGKTGSFVRLKLATNKRYTNKQGESVQETQWHTVYLSNGVGKYALSHFKKGDGLYVTGELQHKKWTDKNGETHYSTAVYASQCQQLAEPQQKEDATSPENSAETSSVDVD